MPFIVFEGIDRSGKTTQCRMMADHLKKQYGEEHVLLCRYPDRTSPTGTLINQFLNGDLQIPLNAASLLFMANLWEMSENLTTALAQGKYVIMDRYLLSNIAYSTARGMDRELCTRLCSGLPLPDITIFMEVDPEVVSQRGDFGKEIFESVEFQQKVAKIMKTLIEEGKMVGKLVPINASQSIKVINQEIIQKVL